MAVSNLRNIFMQCGFTVWAALSQDLKPPSDLCSAVCVHAWKRLHDSCCKEEAERHLCTSSGTLRIGAQTGLSRAECVAARRMRLSAASAGSPSPIFLLLLFFLLLVFWAALGRQFWPHLPLALHCHSSASRVGVYKAAAGSPGTRIIHLPPPSPL